MLARATAFPLNNGEMIVEASGVATPPGSAARYFVVADQRNLLCSLNSIRVTVINNRRTGPTWATGSHCWAN